MNSVGTISQEESFLRAYSDVAVHRFPDWEPRPTGFAAGAALVAAVSFLVGTAVGALLA